MAHLASLKITALMKATGGSPAALQYQLSHTDLQAAVPLIRVSMIEVLDNILTFLELAQFSSNNMF